MAMPSSWFDLGSLRLSIQDALSAVGWYQYLLLTE